MIDKRDVQSFFDRLAPGWDAELVRNEPVIAAILDNAGVQPGVRVLDVACGTGVLFRDYTARQAGHVTAIDLSPEMAARVICAEGLCDIIYVNQVDDAALTPPWAESFARASDVPVVIGSLQARRWRRLT